MILRRPVAPVKRLFALGLYLGVVCFTACDSQDLNLEPCVTVIRVNYDNRADQTPEPIGGLQTITNDARFTVLAQNALREGTVVLRFSIDEQGHVFDAVVTNGIGAGLDEEALRVLRQAVFTPAMKDEQPVISLVNTIEIRFNLECVES